MICDWKIYICSDNGEKFFGKGPYELLLNVKKYGSLNKAAAEMELSYHKALKLIKSAEKGFGCALMNKKIGGENGGGSLLTPKALEILDKYEKFKNITETEVSKAFYSIFKSEA